MFAGQILQQLVKLLTASFNENSLIIFVRTQLEADLHKDFVGKNQPLTDQIAQLIAKLDEGGRLLFFVDKFIESRPDLQTDTDAKSILDAARLAITQPAPSSSDNIAAVRSGVEAVASNMQVDAVRTIVAESRDVLTGLAEKISLLRTYKDLHDTLHFAKQGFSLFDSSSQKIETQPESASSFEQCVNNMENLALQFSAKVQDLPPLPPTIRKEQTNWIARFTAAVAMARQGADNTSKTDARKGVLGIKTILSTQPFLINEKLAAIAQELEVEKLKTLFATAANVPTLSAQRDTFQEGSDAADRLFNQIRAQVTQHDLWQQVDRDLIGLDDSMGRFNPEDPGDFDILWEAILKDLEAVKQTEPTAPWITNFTPLIDSVLTSRDQHEWTKLKSAFERFFGRANNQFFAVDAKLKTLAGEVSNIGQPLNQLLAQP